METSGFRLVLSRKGFDSGSGGCASPLFPNGRFYSLPIDFASGAQKRYGDIGNGVGLDGSDMGTVVEQLTAGRVRCDSLAHFDPDIDGEAVPRLPGWRGSFGQVETAQVHLANQGVGVGDVFLFHGWFRAVRLDNSGRWRFEPNAPDLNVIFGWLQVGEVIDLEQTSPNAVMARYPWLRDHPHLHVPADVRLSPSAHAIYIATERLCVPGTAGDTTQGAGVFRTYDPRLVLTAIGAGGRSVWKLPRWFKGDSERPWLTQYPRPEWWTDYADSEVLLRPVGRQGQEAVLDCRDRPDAGPWISSLFA
ncbi:MAG: hypothetical protein AB7O77_15260 [Phycisphaerales bacterium]